MDTACEIYDLTIQQSKSDSAVSTNTVTVTIESEAKKRKLNNMSAPPTTIHNSFAGLDDADDEFIESLRLKNKNRRMHNHTNTPSTSASHTNYNHQNAHNTNNTSINNNAQNTQNSNGNINSDKKNKMPPINIFHQDIKDIITVIQKSCNIYTFFIKKVTNNKHAIYTNNIEDFNKITHTLKKGAVQLFTFYIHTKTIKNSFCTTQRT